MSRILPTTRDLRVAGFMQVALLVLVRFYAGN
jgi:hypothetical protein